MFDRMQYKRYLGQILFKNKDLGGFII